MINKEFIETKLKEVEEEFNEIDKKSITLKEDLTKIETRKEQLKGTYTAFYQMLTMLDDSETNQDEENKKEDTTNTNEDLSEDTENNN